MKKESTREVYSTFKMYWIIVGYFLALTFSVLMPILAQSFTFFDLYSSQLHPVIETLFLFLLLSLLSSPGAIVAYHAFVLAVAPRLWKIGTLFMFGPFLAEFILKMDSELQYDSSFSWVLLSAAWELAFKLYWLIPLFIFVYLFTTLIITDMRKKLRGMFTHHAGMYVLLFLVFLVGLTQVPVSSLPITDQYDSEAWYYLHRGMPFQFAGAIRGDSDVPWTLLRSFRNTGTEWYNPAWYVVYSLPELIKQVLFLLPFALIMGVSLAQSNIVHNAKRFIILSLFILTVYLFWSFHGI